MKKLTLIAFALAALFAAAPVLANGTASSPAQLTREQVRRNIEVMLSGYEFIPGKSDWNRLGPLAESVLIDMSQDDKLESFQRARAISSLHHFPTDRVFQHLEKLVTQPALDPYYRRKAVTAIGYTFQSRSVPVLQKALADSDEFVRDAAVQKLASIQDVRVLPILKAHAQIEQKQFIRDYLTRMVPRLESSLGKVRQLKK
ncbi:MAG: hypothetical protein GMKNLPBB_00581 [Myxococcota bacterium]|nr:hypothetical protein [Myxococcota bacterium]